MIISPFIGPSFLIKDATLYQSEKQITFIVSFTKTNVLSLIVNSSILGVFDQQMTRLIVPKALQMATTRNKNNTVVKKKKHQYPSL